MFPSYDGSPHQIHCIMGLCPTPITLYHWIAPAIYQMGVDVSGDCAPSPHIIPLDSAYHISNRSGCIMGLCPTLVTLYHWIAPTIYLMGVDASWHCAPPLSHYTGHWIVPTIYLMGVDVSWDCAPPLSHYTIG